MQSDTTSSWKENLYNSLMQFIAPAHLQQSEDRLRVLALLYLLLATFCFGFCLTIIRYLAGASILIEATETILAFILYMLIRRGFYTPVAYFSIAASAAFASSIYLISPNTYFQLGMIYTAIVSMTLAALLTNKRITVLVIILNLVIVLALLSQLSDFAAAERFNEFMIFAFLCVPIGIVSIVTEDNDKLLKQEIHELRESQIQFHYLFDTFPQPIVIHTNGKIIYSNASAERLFQKRYLLDSSITDFIPTGDISNSEVDNHTGSMIVEYDTRLKLENNQTVPLRVTTQVVSYQKHLATLMLFQKPRFEHDKKNKLLESIIATLDKPLIALSTDFETVPKILFVNEAFCELTGYQERELIDRAHPLLQSAIGGYTTIASQLKSALNKNEGSLLAELLQYRKDGTSILTEWNGQIFYDAMGQAQYCIISVSNLNEVAERDNGLNIIQQAIVSELGLLSLSMDSHYQLLEHAVIMCDQVLKIDNCVIFEYQAEQNRLECIAVSDNRYDYGAYTLGLEPSSSQPAYALFMKEAIISENFQKETRFSKFPQTNTPEVSSALSVIIPGREKPYGVLSICNYDKKTDIEEYLYFLQAVANVLGSFVESSQAHQAEREQREFAEALRDATAILNMRLELSEMLDKLMGYVRQLVPQVESGSIMLWDIAAQGYRFIYTWNYPPQLIMERSFAADEFPLMQKMMGDHRPMILTNVDDEPLWVRTNNLEQIRSYLGASIIVQGECIGFFHLNSTKLAAFSEHDALRLQTFADKTGTAISNARYAQELEALVKERTEELQKERELLSSILEASGEGIIYVENYEIKFANRSAAEITGYPIEELIGMDARKFRPDDISPEEIAMLNKIPSEMKVGIPWRAELRQQRKDGSIFYAGITNSKLADTSENVYHSVILVRDISQAKALDNAKSRFIANAAHELRSPITSLKTRMYMINKQPEKVDYHIERLEEIVGRMNRLVSDLLDMSYFEYGRVTLRPESIILQDVVERIADILEPEAELEELHLLRELPEIPIHIWADVHRIEQVLTNLIVNAIHYTPHGGHVCVICSADSDERVAIIRVEDTGDGIPPEHLDNIFEAFYRLDNNMEKKGTGLGLSITREIIELHQGTIRAESEADKGSAFIITLPLLEE